VSFFDRRKTGSGDPVFLWAFFCYLKSEIEAPFSKKTGQKQVRQMTVDCQTKNFA